MNIHRLFREASTVAGCGSTEERLIRLMVWVGTSLRSTMKHSRLKDPLEIWEDGTAWCDQHVRVLSYFAWHLLSVKGRAIAMIHVDGEQGHTVCELYYDGAWHVFDPHTEHLAVYRDDNGLLLSRAHLCAHPSYVAEQLNRWPQEGGLGKEGFYMPGHKAQVRDFIWDAP